MSLAPDDVKIKPATVTDEFSYVIEQITELLQSHDPKVLVKRCVAIMASDAIKFFSDNQIKLLNQCNNVSLLFHELSHLWSWSNHSVLRVLVGFSNEAIKLLDKFDLNLDVLQPIESYPIFEIVSTDVMSHTTMNVKFGKSTAQNC